jgi:hypothetical protein
LETQIALKARREQAIFSNRFEPDFQSVRVFAAEVFFCQMFHSRVHDGGTTKITENFFGFSRLTTGNRRMANLFHLHERTIKFAATN